MPPGFRTAATRCAAWLGSLALAGLLAATPGRAADDTLTLYSGQHEQTVDRLIAEFQRQTGIAVRVRSGEGPGLANQIVTEGGASPADVYFTENSPELQLLAEHGLLAPVEQATLAQVPARYSSPQGLWLGVLARESVLVYATAAVPPGALPRALLDLAGPAWKGRLGIAPTDADFLPVIGAVAAAKGHEAALRWLQGLEANAQVFEDDEGVVAAVERGAVAAGVVNNYYWQRLAQQNGVANMHSAIYHFPHGDLGGVVNVSGAAALRSSAHMAAAQRFLAFLVSEPTQAALGRSDVTFEYPLRPGVAANPMLRPLAQLDPPAIEWTGLGDDAVAVTLLRQAGLL